MGMLYDDGAEFTAADGCNRCKCNVSGCIPGNVDCTEINCSRDAGADAVKLFPAQCLGPDFIKAMRGPLPKIRLVPTGGVTPEAARSYIATGAWALGVGSELIGKDVMNDKGFESLRRRAFAFAEAARGAK